MFKKIISIVVALSMISTLSLQAAQRTIPNSDTPLQEIEMSEARQNYYTLLQGDYRGKEMRVKFEELFGTNYTNEDILNNYTAIFDIEASEVDDGILELLTMEDDIAGEELPTVNTPLDTEQPDISPMPEEIPILEEIPLEDGDVMGSNDPSVPSLYAGDGFTNITLVSKTNNSVTFDIWYKSADVNNILNKYESYSKTWTNLLGRDGNSAANTRRYTATNLLPGAVYKFIATTYDRSTSTWKDSEIIVQTLGLKPPSFTLVGQTTNSITVNAVFPSEYQWGNKIEYYDNETSR